MNCEGVDLGLASNLTCLCRRHHLLKTFWGWSSQQLPDGTLIWTSPSAQTYITTPGSALLFPNLCAPTGELPPNPAHTDPHCGDRSAMMPQRRRTRAHNRAAYVAAQRRHNRTARELDRQNHQAARFGPAPPNNDDEPPPF